MSDDLLALIGDAGEVAAVKDAMVRGFQSVMPKAVETYYGVPDTMNLPCVCVGEVEITPSRTMGNQEGPGTEEMVVTISIFVSAAEEQDSQRVLDALIGRKGPVRRAIWDMRGPAGESALDGAADDLYLFNISGYGMVSIGDNGTLYGATLSVRVIVS
jgi:hypothetical protein